MFCGVNLLYRKAFNALLSVMVILLVAVLAFSCYTISNKNSTIEKLSNQINENSIRIEEHLRIKTELEEKIKSGEEALKDVESKLQESINQINILQKENSDLKIKIEELKLQNSKTDKVCYLTFDDGPSENTLRVLKILNDYNVKATFFVIKNAKSDYIKQIAANGHTVGLHTATHIYSNIYSNQDAYYADLNEISNTVESQIGIKSNVLRFPGGSSNIISKQYCEGIMTALTKSVVERGYYYFDWNVDSGDAAGNNIRYQIIRDNVLNGAKGKGSICVLMHDTDSKNTTVDALPEIIEGLAAMGYRFSALSGESFGFRHGNINN